MSLYCQLLSDRYRDCGEGASVVWEGPYKGMAIAGNDLISLSVASLDECKKACLQQTTFHCRSFDYYRPSDICYLQAVTR